MKTKLTALALSGLIICALGLPAGAAEVPPAGGASSLPDSLLYYGEVKELIPAEDGTLAGLRMDSPKSGEFVMKLSDETFWIDSGNRTPSGPEGLAAGERLYVFHSPVSTRSLPPQSAAFAVVRNIPQDAGCARYHKVEAVEERDGTLQITTDQGGLLLFADQETEFSSYPAGGPEGREAVWAGGHIMAWYDAVALSFPGQAHVRHIMTLEGQPLTRGAFASLLHAAQGSPAAGGVADYRDLSPDAPCFEALRWAAGEGLISGYGDGTIGPEDPLNREQLAVILWHRAGSPRLMDYPGLTRYSDAGDISPFAQPALAWAHQKGLVPDGGRLGPRDLVTRTEAEAMLLALEGRQ